MKVLYFHLMYNDVLYQEFDNHDNQLIEENLLMIQEQEIKVYNLLMILKDVKVLKMYQEDIHFQVDLNNEDMFEELNEVQKQNLIYTNRLQ